MVINLILEHHSPVAYDNLRSALQDCQDRLTALEHDYRALELKYGAEINFNSQLIDLLKANGIPFRHVLSHVYRYERKGP